MAAPAPSQDLRVLLSCPQCGAAGEWTLLQVLRRCPYCSSVLWRPHDPGQRECFAVLDQAHRPELCLDVLRTADACREQARLRGLSDGGAVDDIAAPNRLLAEALTPEIETLKARRAHLFRLREAHTVHAPYLMVHALLAYHALGRTRGRGAERKEFRPFLFSLDAVLPAYPAPWDFRDRGLWFSRQALIPLDEASLATGGFMRPEAMEGGAAGPARPWLGRRELLEADLQPIAFSARVVHVHEWWIFRPFHCVQADTPLGSGWFLVDGQFRTLAGYLGEAEAARVVARDWLPLDLERFRKPQVRPLPCRCPVCAGALSVNERGTRQLCPHCGRLLEPGPSGFTVRPYRLLDPGSIPWRPRTSAGRTAWLPFWRLSGRWTLEEKTFPTPEALAAGLLPPMKRAAPGPHRSAGPHYFPAFDGWLYDQYDRWCLQTARALGEADAEPVERRFHLSETIGPDDLLIPPSQDASLYESQMDGLAPALLPPALQARLNAAVVKRLAGVKFETESRELVFVPIPYGPHGDLPGRLLGPESAVDAAPLASGGYPPILYRNVQRWKDRSAAAPPDPETLFTRPMR